MKRVRIELPAVQPPAAEEPFDIGYPFAGWLGVGTLLRREIDTSGSYPGESLLFAVRHLVTQEFYAPPEDFTWTVDVVAYGGVSAGDISISGGSPFWTATLSPDLAGLDGFAVIEITGTVGAATVVGPFALVLIFGAWS